MQKKRNYKFKPYDELTFTDSFMFYATMQNEEICKGVIERLLGIKVRKFNYINGEQTFNPVYDSKSVRLDVYAEDSKRVFDIEVQTYNENEIGKRLRYYQSIIDIDHLNRGSMYDELKESIIIFICTEDLIGENMPRYTFSNLCHENTKIKLDDKTLKVIYNLKGDRSKLNPKERELLDFMATGKSDSDFTKKIEKKIAETKCNQTWRKKYMTLEMYARHMAEEYFEENKDEILAEAREEGLAQGIEQGLSQGLEQGRSQGVHDTKFEVARNFLAMNLSIEQIAKGTGLSIEEIEALQKN